MDPRKPQPIPGRTFERTQGCWNCIHFDAGDKAKKYFSACKDRDMLIAARFAAEHPLGVRAPKVLQIAKTIDEAEAAIATGTFGICTGGGVTSDFVHNAHLCNKWTGAVGASVARAGGKADDLPDEMKDKLGDHVPVEVSGDRTGK